MPRPVVSIGRQAETTRRSDTSRDEAVRATDWRLLSRYGVVFRRLLGREVGGVSGVSWCASTGCSRLAVTFVRPIRRGMSGEQYACRCRRFDCVELRRSGPDEILVVISGADPLNLDGSSRWGTQYARRRQPDRLSQRDALMARKATLLRTLADADASVLGRRRPSQRAACPSRTDTSDGFGPEHVKHAQAEAVRLAQQIPRRGAAVLP